MENRACKQMSAFRPKELILGRPDNNAGDDDKLHYSLFVCLFIVRLSPWIFSVARNSKLSG